MVKGWGRQIEACRREPRRFKWPPTPHFPMAKAKLNTGIRTLRGRVGDVIFKHYSYGRRVALSADEEPKIQRGAAGASAAGEGGGAFYRQVVADATLRRKYARIAARRHIPLSR